jgi:hypothetical protein
MSRDLDVGARAQQLAQLLLHKDANGAYAVPDRAARATVVLLALGVAHADPDAPMPPFVTQQLGAFCVEAGVAPQTPPAQLLGTLEAFLMAQIPPALRAQLEAFYREEAGRSGAAANAAVAQMLGMKRDLTPLQAGSRPAGTTAAGPMARFALANPKPTK